MLKLTGRTKKALAEVEVEDAEGKRQWRKMDCRRLFHPGQPVEVLEGGTLAAVGVVEWLPGNIDPESAAKAWFTDGRVWVPGTAPEADDPPAANPDEAETINKADADEIEFRVAETEPAEPEPESAAGAWSAGFSASFKGGEEPKGD